MKAEVTFHFSLIHWVTEQEDTFEWWYRQGRSHKASTSALKKKVLKHYLQPCTTMNSAIIHSKSLARKWDSMTDEQTEVTKANWHSTGFINIFQTEDNPGYRCAYFLPLTSKLSSELALPEVDFYFFTGPLQYISIDTQAVFQSGIIFVHLFHAFS